MLDAAGEREALWNTFVDAQRSLDVQFNFATPERFINAITNGCPAIHFSGHGTSSGLLFEDNIPTGKGKIVSTAQMSHYFGPDHNLKLVFVSACESLDVGRFFASAGVKHVICVRGEVADNVSKIFAKNFYLALLAGKTIRESVRLANVHVREDSIASCQRGHSDFMYICHNVELTQEEINGEIVRGSVVELKERGGDGWHRAEVARVNDASSFDIVCAGAVETHVPLSRIRLLGEDTRIFPNLTVEKKWPSNGLFSELPNLGIRSNCRHFDGRQFGEL